MIATCNQCHEFKVPWDEIGQTLMTAHLKHCTKPTAAETHDEWRKVIAERVADTLVQFAPVLDLPETMSAYEGVSG